MSDEIHADTLETFRAGKWRVMVVTAGGHRDVLKKAEGGGLGTVRVPFAAGDVVLAGPGDTVICGPISAAGALELATRVLAGDQRILTDSLTQLMLATAVFAYAERPKPPPATEPQAAAMPA